ncbi:MAG: hypothetical protein QXX99_02245 [Candidatus Bathyarchaeia archaeon]
MKNFLYCSSLLEEKVAKAYEHIAKLINDKIVSCLLRYIAHDSFKHAECFRLMAELLSHGGDVHFEDCIRVWGESWLTTIKDAEKIMEKSEISPVEIRSIINGLEKIERFAAEEYLTALYAKIIELVADKEGVNLGPLKTILNWIIEEENKHRQILEIIRGLLPNP